MSHSPLALLRAYIHMKQRCHVALAGCRNRSLGVREEYRITGAVLVVMDRILEQADQASRPFPVDAPQHFFRHRTDQLLGWLRWNINKLCVGFEMTYSLQPRTVVHWEHTRVMMMFLRCLLCAYGGQGNHLRRSNGLWLDRHVGPPPDGSDTERVQEGMGMATTLERYGYAWIQDRKLDWDSMTFKPPHRAWIVFNTPSLMSAYHSRYQSLVRTKTDFVLFHDIFTRMKDLRSDFPRSALLLRLLVQLCLRAFRQDVFTALGQARTQQPLHPEYLEAACLGETPLTIKGLGPVFRHSHFHHDLQFVSGPKMKVTHIEVLFAWLWGWDGDGNNGDWSRKHWERKPYRLFYRQCFAMIAQVYGLQQAREWRTTVKHTFIRTHWILPYPSASLFWSRGQRGRKLQTWASVHPQLLQYYQQQQQRPGQTPRIIQPYEVEKLPLTGWIRSDHPFSLDVVLPSIPTDLDAWLAAVVEPSAAAAALAPLIPLPAIGVRESSLSRYLATTSPEYRLLRSYLQERQLPLSQVHVDPAWLTQHLVYYTEALLVAQQQRVRDLDFPQTTRSWQTRRRPMVSGDLSSLNPSLSLINLEEDSDPENLRSKQERHSRRLLRMQRRLRIAQKETHRFLQSQRVMGDFHQATQPTSPLTLTQAQWEAGLKQFREARDQRRQARGRLSQISQQVTTNLRTIE
jgi:hypothetical protein